jgi:hypothetical protein
MSATDGSPKDLGKDQATLKAPFADQANAWDSQFRSKSELVGEMPCVAEEATHTMLHIGQLIPIFPDKIFKLLSSVCLVLICRLVACEKVGTPIYHRSLFGNSSWHFFLLSRIWTLSAWGLVSHWHVARLARIRTHTAHVWLFGRKKDATAHYLVFKPLLCLFECAQPIEKTRLELKDNSKKTTSIMELLEPSGGSLRLRSTKTSPQNGWTADFLLQSIGIQFTTTPAVHEYSFWSFASKGLMLNNIFTMFEPFLLGVCIDLVHRKCIQWASEFRLNWHLQLQCRTIYC